MRRWVVSRLSSIQSSSRHLDVYRQQVHPMKATHIDLHYPFPSVHDVASRSSNILD